MPGTTSGHGQAGGNTAGKTAYDYRDRLQSITGWSDDDLRQLPIFDGETFRVGETYFNLNLPEVGPFRAEAADQKIQGYLYVAKADVPDHVWLRLVDAWGDDLKLGNAAPQPGAFGGEGEVRVGRSDLDSLSAEERDIEP